MTIDINIIIFGKNLVTGVELLERNVALTAVYFGLLLKLLITNINSKEEDMPILDIFFGKGFSALFKGDLAYIMNPLKSFFKLEGPLFSLLVVTIAGLTFPMIVDPIIDLETFRSFLFKGLITGYSADLLTAQVRDIIKTTYSNRKNLQQLLKEV